MSWFYMAMQREPVVMWSCFIGGLGTQPLAWLSPKRRDVAHTRCTDGGPDRPPLLRGSAPVRAPGNRGIARRHIRKGPRVRETGREPHALCLPDTVHASAPTLQDSDRVFIFFVIRPQASRFPWWSRQSARRSGARKPCLRLTRTRLPRRCEDSEVLDIRAFDGASLYTYWTTSQNGTGCALFEFGCHNSVYSLCITYRTLHSLVKTPTAGTTYPTM
jgi:hypothetical protein